MTEPQVDTQVIANLVIRNGAGHVLFVQYDPEDPRWWLPGQDVEPFTHPDDAAKAVLADLGGLTALSSTLAFVESFRGRRGWHLAFHYDVRVDKSPTGTQPTQWFDPAELPKTAHGGWEKSVVKRVVDG